MLEKIGFLNHEISWDDRFFDISTCLPSIFIFKYPTDKILYGSKLNVEELDHCQRQLILYLYIFFKGGGANWFLVSTHL